MERDLQVSEISFFCVLASSSVHEHGRLRMGNVPGQQTSPAKPEERKLNTKPIRHLLSIYLYCVRGQLYLRLYFYKTQGF